jgi:hypothetical protein
MTTTKKPADTIRDGALRATIWANFGEKGTFYSVEFSRTYTDADGKFHDAGSFSGTEIIQIARLAHLAYTRIGELRQQDTDRLNSKVA